MASLSSARVLSDVWEFFKNAKAQRAKCSLCSKELGFYGGTTITESASAALQKKKN